MNSIANWTFLISHSFISTLYVCFTLMFTGQLHADPGANTPPNCVTNIDAEGTVIAGHFGLVISPTPFFSVESKEDELEVFQNTRYKRGVLIYSIPKHNFELAGNSGQSNPGEDVETKMVFTMEDGTVAHSCTVRSVPFDETIHDPKRTQVGDCDLKQISGLKSLSAGHVQIFEPPLKLSEVASAPKTVLLASQVTAQLIQLRGQSEGWANFVWFPEQETEFGYIGGICNIAVAKSTSTIEKRQPEHLEACKDVDNKDLTLAIGEKATIAMSLYGNNLNFFSGKLDQNYPVIEVTTPSIFGSSDLEEFEVIASRPGKMSLVRRIYLPEEPKLKYDVCVVTVN
ncbi:MULTISPECIES: hypothetical protein [unclassified Ruegeria]|uniref:hypothetical protein n=1 Tax=unclassified Ruegeria TaxID=2625375 RepID=UPI001AD95310|nr:MULTISPECIES: hypothetical protein [unclassified Ruegeria]MBO9411312.1 hypothetical protein [Ruegeria sp. R8_1]MBO9415513.1 hypothetical protein [Ruegeria sp. R8_2]